MRIKYRIELPDLLRYLELPLIGVELGVAEGFFSRDLLIGGLDKLYSIDNWGHIAGIKGDGNFPDSWHETNYENAKKLLAPFGRKSIILKGLTDDMHAHIPDFSCGLIYHDGDHSYEQVKKDIPNYFDKLVTGGVFAFHDYLSDAYGVKQGVEEFCYKKYDIHIIPENKDEDAGAYFIKY